MRRWCVVMVLAVSIVGCGADEDEDEPFGGKTPMPMDQVPAVVLKAAKAAAPELTFYAAFKDRFNGQDCIELKGRNKVGKIKEIEVTPDGKVLGTE
jgi:hypothetical protein